jgi:hypothetical protein
MRVPPELESLALLDDTIISYFWDNATWQIAQSFASFFVEVR